MSGSWEGIRIRIRIRFKTLGLGPLAAENVTFFPFFGVNFCKPFWEGCEIHYWWLVVVRNHKTLTMRMATHLVVE